MPILEIFGMPASNYVWTARMACAEKGVAYELKPAGPHTPEIDAIHPMGRMPVMRHGEACLFETAAICTYIDRFFPGPGLVPSGALAAAEAAQWVSFINTSLDPACVRRYALGYFFPDTPDGSPNRAKIDPAIAGVEKHLGIIDRAVAKTGHLVGTNFTIADMFLMPIARYLTKLPESSEMIGKLPALTAYIGRHSSRASFVASRPPPLAKTA